MKDTRTSTSSQRLAGTLNTLIECPEADITAIPAVRPKLFPTGNNRNIAVSIQELVYGGKKAGVGASAKYSYRYNELIYSSEELHGPRKDKGSSEWLYTHFLQRTSPTDKSLQPPKNNQKGKKKGKGKGKAQLEQALPAELQNSQEREDSHGKCVQHGKKSDGIQKQGGGKNEPILSKETDLLKLINNLDTCNKQILANLNNSKYIQKKLGREILQVKESQKSIIGLESVNKANILSLTQICAKIECKVFLLNQPDYNYISFINKKLRELRIQVQNLENSTGHNASLFQEQLEESDKERLEMKEDIQSSINNISLKNEFPKQSTPIIDGNVLNVNNHLHHTIPSNAELETACNFEDIPKLEEWPTFSGEGEYNYMEYMKTIDTFKEDFSI
ncbi:hypothetical protein O181_121242, partial [Austropuccinia psidii MF-1]|nr:hypothetical protein [Austropuccinia psidii MF-1]